MKIMIWYFLFIFNYQDTQKVYVLVNIAKELDGAATESSTNIEKLDIFKPSLLHLTGDSLQLIQLL